MRCMDTSGECFARKVSLAGMTNYCDILTKPLSPCPFKKPEREVTNGVWYSYNPACCKEQNRDGA